jgi:hypothetical protein
MVNASAAEQKEFSIMVVFRFKTKMCLLPILSYNGKSLIGNFSLCTWTYPETADMLCNTLRQPRNGEMA